LNTSAPPSLQDKTSLSEKVDGSSSMMTEFFLLMQLKKTLTENGLVVTTLSVLPRPYSMTGLFLSQINKQHHHLFAVIHFQKDPKNTKLPKERINCYIVCLINIVLLYI
jgi:hypothetical protein